MSTYKSDLDIKRENQAHKANSNLFGSQFEVIANTKRGPFSLVIKGLSLDQSERIMSIIDEKRPFWS